MFAQLLNLKQNQAIYFPIFSEFSLEPSSTNASECFVCFQLVPYRLIASAQQIKHYQTFLKLVKTWSAYPLLELQYLLGTFASLRGSFKHSQPNQSETKHDYHLDYHKRLEFLSIGIFIWNNRFDLKSEFFLLDSFIIIFYHILSIFQM